MACGALYGMGLRRALLTVVTFAIALFACLDVLARPRVLVLTDIENEPDDAMSMVRFLTYATSGTSKAWSQRRPCTRRTRSRLAHPRDRRSRMPRCATTSSFMSPVFRPRIICSP